MRTKYKGAWGLCDNGYHRWSCTQAPGKHDLLFTELRLSPWIESFRKDVECVFGILKGRFRVLKTGIRLEGANAADDIWHTCCALHNMLLEVDGMDKEWNSEWDGVLGKNDPREMERMAPFAIRRLQNPQQFGSREHELQSRWPSPLIPQDEDDSDDDSVGRGLQRDQDGTILINSLSYTEFRQLLVVHFDILSRQNKIVWPRNHRVNV
jgi:DDE superfamily endonuclease